MMGDLIDLAKRRAERAVEPVLGDRINAALVEARYKCAFLVSIDGDGDPTTGFFHLADDLTARDLVCLIGALEMGKHLLVERLEEAD